MRGRPGLEAILKYANHTLSMPCPGRRLKLGNRNRQQTVEFTQIKQGRELAVALIRRAATHSRTLGLNAMAEIPGTLARQWLFPTGSNNRCGMDIRCRGHGTYVLVTNVPVQGARLTWHYQGRTGVGTTFQRSGR